MTRRPLLGAIGIVLRGDDVLMVQRRKSPDAGLWGYPGGHVEWGETALAAAAREIDEETGIRVTPVDYLTAIDVLRPGPGGQAQVHYLLAAVLCTYQGGEPIASDEVAAAAWISQADIRAAALPMSARVGAILDLARARGTG